MKPTIMQTTRLASKSGVAALPTGCCDGEAVAREPLPVMPGMPLIVPVPVAPAAPARLLLLL